MKTYNTILDAPTPKSPRNKYRIEINSKKAIPELGSCFSFGTMTINNLEDNNFYKHYKEMCQKNGGASVTIKENKKSYPNFQWEVLKNYEV